MVSIKFLEYGDGPPGEIILPLRELTPEVEDLAIKLIPIPFSEAPSQLEIDTVSKLLDFLNSEAGVPDAGDSQALAKSLCHSLTAVAHFEGLTLAPNKLTDQGRVPEKVPVAISGYTCSEAELAVLMPALSGQRLVKAWPPTSERSGRCIYEVEGFDRIVRLATFADAKAVPIAFTTFDRVQKKRETHSTEGRPNLHVAHSTAPAAADRISLRSSAFTHTGHSHNDLLRVMRDRLLVPLMHASQHGDSNRALASAMLAALEMVLSRPDSAGGRGRDQQAGAGARNRQLVEAACMHPLASQLLLKLARAGPIRVSKEGEIVLQLDVMAPSVSATGGVSVTAARDDSQLYGVVLRFEGTAQCTDAMITAVLQTIQQHTPEAALLSHDGRLFAVVSEGGHQGASVGWGNSSIMVKIWPRDAVSYAAFLVTCRPVGPVSSAGDHYFQARPAMGSVADRAPLAAFAASNGVAETGKAIVQAVQQGVSVRQVMEQRSRPSAPAAPSGVPQGSNSMFATVLQRMDALTSSVQQLHRGQKEQTSVMEKGIGEARSHNDSLMRAVAEGTKASQRTASTVQQHLPVMVQQQADVLSTMRQHSVALTSIQSQNQTALGALNTLAAGQELLFGEISEMNTVQTELNARLKRIEERAAAKRAAQTGTSSTRSPAPKKPNPRGSGADVVAAADQGGDQNGMES